MSTEKGGNKMYSTRDSKANKLKFTIKRNIEMKVISGKGQIKHTASM